MIDQESRVEASLSRIEGLLSRLLVQFNKIDKKLDHALYEDGDDVPEQKPREVDTRDYPKDRQFNYDNDKPGEILTEDIIKYGEQIGYRRYSGEDANELRKFIVFILNNPEKFNSIELEYAGYANKPHFDDLRVSINTFHILNGAYRKLYGRAMPFRYTPGTMYRYGNQLHWVWKEPTR
jgi:hypothetical protein